MRLLPSRVAICDNVKKKKKKIERYLLLDQLGFLNDHAKFALTYGMLLFEANTLPLLVSKPVELTPSKE